MERITREALKRLADHEEPLSLSLYMPTNRGNQNRQDRIRLKNLIRDAQEQMVAMGLREPQARERLAGLSALLDDSEFWRNQDEALAVLASSTQTNIYQLPRPVEPLVTVQDRYYLKPMLWVTNGQGLFYILAISQNTVRLLRAGRETAELVPMEGAPRGMADLLQYVETQKQLQFHSQMASPTGGRRVPMYHGHGTGTDDSREKRRLTEYCQMIDAAVIRSIPDRRTPLLLAGAEPLVSLYRDSSDYGHFWPDILRGNPDRLEPAQLHEQATGLMTPILEANRRRAVELYHQAAGGGMASHELKDVLPAAQDQRVATLFVSLNDQCWGRYDPADKEASIHPLRQPGDQDLLDVAAVTAYRTGGNIYVMPRDQMPENTMVAATFRFAS